MNSRIIIGYSPQAFLFPSIPERVVIKYRDRILCVSRDCYEEVEIGESGFKKLLDSNLVTRLEKPELFILDNWLCLEQSAIVWFKKSDEAIWRMNRARQLLVEAKDKPASASVFLLVSCANILGINLPTLFGELERYRKFPRETFSEIFDRSTEKLEILKKCI